MKAAIIIRSDKLEAAGREHRDVCPAQPCATRDSAQIKFTEHVGQGVFALSAICAGDGACVRAVGILGSLETETVAPQIQRPAPNFQSAHASRAATAGASSVISAPLRPFNSFRHLAGWSFLVRLHSASALFQSSARYRVKSFHVVSSLLPVIQKNGRRMRQGVGKRPQEFVKPRQGNE